MSEHAFGVMVLALVPLIWAIYCLPAIIAFRRGHPNRWLILAVNVMLGATGIGWAVALVWACNAAHLTWRPDGSNGGESGLNLFANDVRSVRVIGSGGATAASAAVRLTSRRRWARSSAWAGCGPRAPSVTLSSPP